jgi:hypothetical protein
VFKARGIASAVDAAAAGECLFNDNRVESRGDREVTVKLATQAAIVNANRVRGAALSIKVIGAKSAAVLGNITTGEIHIGEDALSSPWKELNLHHAG